MGTRPGPGGERKLLSLSAPTRSTPWAPAEPGRAADPGAPRALPAGAASGGTAVPSRAWRGHRLASGSGGGRGPPCSPTPPDPDSAGRRRAPATPASRGEKYPAEKESQGSLAREARAEAGPAGAGVTWDLPMVGPGVPGLIAG